MGWGTQTTLLALLTYPLAYLHGAQYILFGSEYSNNEYRLYDGWKNYLSYDQTTFWTQQQNIMIQLLSQQQTSVHSSLEPLEELMIFYILHTRYPNIGIFQFSCSSEHKLFKDSQWCHKCYKCVRMYIFAVACNIDPTSIGFKKNLLLDVKLYDHYFTTDMNSGSEIELDFVFYVLSKKQIQSPVVELFNSKKKPHLKPYSWYKSIFTTLRPEKNLPPLFRKRLLSIFTQELQKLQNILP